MYTTRMHASASVCACMRVCSCINVSVRTAPETRLPQLKPRCHDILNHGELEYLVVVKGSPLYMPSRWGCSRRELLGTMGPPVTAPS